MNTKTELLSINFNSNDNDEIKFYFEKINKIYTISIADNHKNIYSNYKKDYEDFPTQEEVFEILVNFDIEENGEGLLLSILGEIDIDTIEGFENEVTVSIDIYPDLSKMFKNYLKNNGFN
jgi:hypothetical protein